MDLRDAQAPVEMTEIAPGWVREDLARQAATVLPGKRLSFRGPQDPHSRVGKCHREGSVAALRCSRLDLVVVTLVGDEDMAGDRKAPGVIEAPRRDADVVASYSLPEQRGAATAAKSAARLFR